MILKKPSLALAAALPLLLSCAAEAGPIFGPDSKGPTDSIVEQIRKEQVANKRHHKAHLKHTPTPAADPGATPVPQGPAKKAVLKAGGCGPYMYWDNKAKTCADARNKKR